MIVVHRAHPGPSLAELCEVVSSKYYTYIQRPHRASDTVVHGTTKNGGGGAVKLSYSRLRSTGTH